MHSITAQLSSLSGRIDVDMIDHIFMFIEVNGPEIYRLEALGLVETYRRIHPGQGTQNVCYCFDNLFLELLWVDDFDALRSDIVKRTGLYERSLWRTNGTSPFGIAWRGTSQHQGVTVPTWDFKPPYLPHGMSIPVAEDGDDPRQPMMFESPGSVAPAEWPPERRGSLQHGAGLGAVTEIMLEMPSTSPPCDALKAISRKCAPRIQLAEAGTYGLRLRIKSLSEKPDLLLTLPVSTHCEP